MLFEGEATGGAGSTGEAAGDTGGNTGDSWYTGIAPDTAVYLQNKGWLDADPKVAVGKVLNSYMELEKLRGVPADQLLRKPAPNDPAAQRAFYEALGAPKEVAGYAFDYEGHDEGGGVQVKEAVGKLAYDLGLPKDAAEKFFTGILTSLANDASREAMAGEQAYADEMAALRANWAGNFDNNMFIARQAARAFNVSEEAVDAMQATMGAKAVFEFFREVGLKIGEDKYIMGDGGSGRVMTQAEAVAKRADLMKDVGWRTRFLAGGAPERAEFETITRIIAGS